PYRHTICGLPTPFPAPGCPLILNELSRGPAGRFIAVAEIPSVETMTAFRALLVGAGAMGKAWARNLRDCPEVQIAGWVDIAPDRAAQAADELKITGIRTDTDLGRALAH